MAARLLFLNANRQIECEDEDLRFLFEQAGKTNLPDSQGRTLFNLAMKNENEALAMLVAGSLGNEREEEEFSKKDKKQREYKYQFEDMLEGKDELLQKASGIQKKLIEKMITIYKNGLQVQGEFLERRVSPLTPLRSLFTSNSNASHSLSNNNSLENNNPSSTQKGKRKRNSYSMEK